MTGLDANRPPDSSEESPMVATPPVGDASVAGSPNETSTIPTSEKKSLPSPARIGKEALLQAMHMYLGPDRTTNIMLRLIYKHYPQIESLNCHYEEMLDIIMLEADEDVLGDEVLSLLVQNPSWPERNPLNPIFVHHTRANCEEPQLITKGVILTQLVSELDNKVLEVLAYIIMTHYRSRSDGRTDETIQRTSELETETAHECTPIFAKLLTIHTEKARMLPRLSSLPDELIVMVFEHYVDREFDSLMFAFYTPESLMDTSEDAVGPDEHLQDILMETYTRRGGTYRDRDARSSRDVVTWSHSRSVVVR